MNCHEACVCACNQSGCSCRDTGRRLTAPTAAELVAAVDSDTPPPAGVVCGLCKTRSARRRKITTDAGRSVFVIWCRRCDGKTS